MVFVWKTNCNKPELCYSSKKNNEIPYIHEVLQGYQGGVGKTSRLLDGDAEQFLIVHAARPMVKQGLFLTLISGITAGHGFVRYSRHGKFK
jgi:hypothetical protein